MFTNLHSITVDGFSDQIYKTKQKNKNRVKLVKKGHCLDRFGKGRKRIIRLWTTDNQFVGSEDVLDYIWHVCFQGNLEQDRESIVRSH